MAEIRKRFYWHKNADGTKTKVYYYPVTHAQAVVGLKDKIKEVAGSAGSIPEDLLDRIAENISLTENGTTPIPADKYFQPVLSGIVDQDLKSEASYEIAYSTESEEIVQMRIDRFLTQASADNCAIYYSIMELRNNTYVWLGLAMAMLEVEQVAPISTTLQPTGTFPFENTTLASWDHHAWWTFFSNYILHLPVTSEAAEEAKTLAEEAKTLASTAQTAANEAKTAAESAEQKASELSRLLENMSESAEGSSKNIAVNTNFLDATGINKTDDEWVGTASNFNKIGSVPITSIVNEAVEGIAVSVKVKTDANSSTSGIGLVLKINYTDGSFTQSSVKNSITEYTTLSVISDATKVVSSIAITYSYAGGNIWHLKEFQIEKGSVVTDYVSPDTPSASFTFVDSVARKKVNMVEERINSLPTYNYNVYSIQKRIEEQSPYYFEVSDEPTTDEYAYLDEKIASVPTGKSFIFITDSHWNSQMSYNANKAMELMSYVKGKLNIDYGISGGDVVDEESTRFKAQNILSKFARNFQSIFGQGALLCIGNHDANATRIGNGGSVDDVIRENEIYNRTIKYLEKTARFDVDGIAKVQSLDIDDEIKQQVISYMKLHYYVDDNANKIRYVVLETICKSYYMITASTGIGGMYMQLDWLAETLKNTPMNYDIVIVGHMFGGSSGTAVNTNVNTKAMSIISAFKSKSNTTINLSADAKWIDYPDNTKENTITTSFWGGITNTHTYDFSESNHSGKIVVLGGHYHYDSSYIYRKEEGGFGGYPYVEDSMNANDAVLLIRFNRDKGIDTIPNQNHTNFSYEYNLAVAEGTTNRPTMKKGTVNENSFDVVTITDDGHCVCTRFGGGTNRIYKL